MNKPKIDYSVYLVTARELLPNDKVRIILFTNI